MTVLLKQEFPQQSFLLVKAAINVNDRLIFQADGQPETEVIVTGVQEGKGLLKFWKIVFWNDNGKA